MTMRQMTPSALASPEPTAAVVAPEQPVIRAPLLPPLLGISPELATVATVYFVQGIMELATLAQTYHLKDTLHADPAQVALFISLTGIPWTIKPVIGFISDTVPLWGYRRSSYLLLASIAGAASYLWMGSESSSLTGFLGAMMLCSTACAVSDVVVDSLVVERARGETQEAAGSLQSLCWLSYAAAQVLTASFSGTLVQELGPRPVFQLTAVFPLLVAGASLMLKEERVAGPGTAGPAADTAPAASQQQGQREAAGVTTAAQTHSKSETEGKAGPGPGSLADAARTQAAALWHSLRRPDISAPLAFLLLLSATPSADSALFFYQTDHLGFTPSFLGHIQLATACASFASVLAYNAWLKKVPIRDMMLWGTLVGAVVQMWQVGLVVGVHREWGVGDGTFALGGTVMLEVVKNIMSMPAMVLAARLCPPGLEATMFATVMSLTNLADGVRVAGGAALMTALHVSPEDWSALPTLLAVCNGCMLLPLMLLNGIPDSATDDTATSTTPTTTASTNAAMTSASTSTNISTNTDSTTATTHVPTAAHSGSTSVAHSTGVQGWAPAGVFAEVAGLAEQRAMAVAGAACGDGSYTHGVGDAVYEDLLGGAGCVVHAVADANQCHHHYSLHMQHSPSLTPTHQHSAEASSSPTGQHPLTPTFTSAATAAGLVPMSARVTQQDGESIHVLSQHGPHSLLDTSSNSSDVTVPYQQGPYSLDASHRSRIGSTGSNEELHHVPMYVSYLDDSLHAYSSLSANDSFDGYGDHEAVLVLAEGDGVHNGSVGAAVMGVPQSNILPAPGVAAVSEVVMSLAAH